MGYAMCGLDSYGHGLNRLLYGDTVLGMRIAYGQFERDDIRELAPMLRGRDRDLNDGLPDSGMDMWTYDVFHTRDMVRQSVLEQQQFVRILRSFDGVRTADDGSILGDIDGDGRVTWATGQHRQHVGHLLGGILGGVPPAPSCCSCRLPEQRGRRPDGHLGPERGAGVPQAVIMPILGLIAGCLPVDGNQMPLAEGVEGGSCLETVNDLGTSRGGQLGWAPSSRTRPGPAPSPSDSRTASPWATASS